MPISPSFVTRGNARVVQGFFKGGRPPLTAGAPVAQPFAGGSAFKVPATVHLAPHGSGQPLPAAVLQRMEEFFGTSFADVRVHVGPQAASIGALAFTMGADLYFAPGQYDPHSAHGQRLLGHELAHVVQQRAGRVRNPLGSGVAVVQDPALEAEAERMGMRVGALPAGGVAQARMGNPVAQSVLSPAGSRDRSGPTRFIVGNHEMPGGGQARKDDFLNTLKMSVVQTADFALRKVGESSGQCPYISYWFKYYGSKEPAHIEKAIQRYAPAVVHARDWRKCIEVVAVRVGEGFREYVQSGSLAGVPTELPDLVGSGRFACRGEVVQPNHGVVQACGNCLRNPPAVNNLPQWTAATVSLGYRSHKVAAWGEMRSHGTFQPSREPGKLGPGLYVGTRRYAGMYFALADGKSTLLEVGYDGMVDWVVEELVHVGDYDAEMEGEYDEITAGPPLLFQRCFKQDGPRHIDFTRFRFREAE